jgi:hypothetical protein
VRRVNLTGLLLLLSTLCGCSFEHEPFRLGSKAHVDSPELHFVEADDYGWFWDPAQAREALAAVQSAQDTDTIIVIFVAGWHHSAKCCDDNVEGFKEVLRRLEHELARPMYSEARAVIHPGSGGPVRVIGIFIGWRGRSLPGVLDYTTFWGRKAAATRVGDTDVREFLVRMRDAYESHASALKGSHERKLMGLITIGHSFGGQVVLRATSTFIEHELMQLGGAPAYLRLPSVAGGGPQLSAPVRGFGDLVVLINPAVEAAAYQRLHALGLAYQYSTAQTPIMLTISADNDVPRSKLFPIGRSAGEWFTGKPSIDDAREREMQRVSLGFFPEHVTHRLEPVDRAVELHSATHLSQPEPTCTGHDRCEYTWYDWKPHPGGPVEADSLTADQCTPEVLGSIAAHDFSARTVFANVVMRPVRGNIPRQALIVTGADPKVIDGHNGMFSEPLLQFLTRYIGFVEAQRFLPLVQPGGCAPGPASR